MKANNFHAAVALALTVLAGQARTARADEALSRPFTLRIQANEPLVADAALGRVFTVRSVFNSVDTSFVEGLSRNLTVRSTFNSLASADEAISRALTMALGFFNAWSLKQPTAELFKIDVQNGLAVSVGTLAGPPLSFSNARLASSPSSDALYALLNPGVAAKIATIETASALVTGVTDVVANRVSGIALDPFGTRLYVAHGDSLNRLGWLDVESGGIQDLGALSFVPATSGVEIEMLAFSPGGVLYGLESSPSSLGRLWLIDTRSLQATLVGAAGSEVMDSDDAAFLGTALWATRSSDANALKIDVQDAAILATTMLEASDLYGVTSRLCATPSNVVFARDHPSDDGGRIALNWSAYTPPAAVVGYEVHRATDSCELTSGGGSNVATLAAGETQFVDSVGVESYKQYFYRIDAVDGAAKPSGAANSIAGVVSELFSSQVVAYPNVVINELAPSGGVPKLGTGMPRILVGEFVELRNLSSEPIDLTGWLLSNGTEKEALTGSIPGNGYFTHSLAVISLPDAGGTLELLPPEGTSFVVDGVSYGTEGGAPAVPAGFTISRVNGTDATDADVTSFGASSPTPGADNEVAAPNLGGSLLMNEVYYGGGAGQDYVELFNPQGGTVAVQQFALSDGAGFVDTLQAGVVLASGGVAALTESSPDPFVRDLLGTQLYLYQFTETGLLQLVDQLGWGAAVGDPAPPLPMAPQDALIRSPDGAAVYLGDQGTNWLECGGGVTLFYGIRTPGQPNVPPNAVSWTVDPMGGDFGTITAALLAAAPGDVIQVAPGMYEESVTLVDGVSLVGGGTSAGDVVISGPGGNTLMRGTNLGAGTLVSRVTLRGGRAVFDGPYGQAPASGGGLRLVNSSAVFQNVRFEFNVAQQNGGAVATEGGLPRFEGCLFQNNHALASGGAVWVVSGGPLFSSCVFVGNESQAAGGAVYVQGGVAVMEHSVLDGNASRRADTGVVHTTGAGRATLTYTLVTNSEAGGPLWVDGGGTVSFGCGALYGNPGWYDMAQGGVDTSAVMLADPGYCQPLALNYSYGSSSPVVALSRVLSGVTQKQVCPEVVGVTGPPCGQTLTTVLEEVAPRVSRLLPPVPNPFNPSTLLRFELSRRGRAELTMYDVRGRRVVELLGGVELGPGSYQAEWRGLDGRGHRVASGIYLARLSLDGAPVGKARKLVLVE